jgi:type VI secretion system protein ImpH
MDDGPGNVDFLDLMRSIEGSAPQKPRIGESATRAGEIVALGQQPHIDHSDANVIRVDGDGDGPVDVTSRFLGLLGPQGALPLHTTYEAVHWENMRDPSFARFADIFNNRFQQLFYRAWANARPVVQAGRPADDQFLAYIGAMIGIATPAMRNRDGMPDYTKLAVAGLLAPSVKSASRVENLLAWLFGSKVKIQQFIGVWLPLEEQEQAALAKGNCSIGVDSLIGKAAFSLRDKFRITFEVRDLEEFERFLPNGSHFELMADAVRFYLGDLYMYDVEIGMAEKETKPIRLGGFGRLGWTSWMKSKNEQEYGSRLRRDCRFHPSEVVALAKQQ